MALLVALTVGVSKQLVREANSKKTQLIFDAVHNAMAEYKVQHDGVWPNAADSAGLLTQLQGLPGPDLIAALKTSGGYNGSAIIDAWGKVIQYNATGGPNGSPQLVSAGPDGTFGTGDDVKDPP
jgi:type II secretory pathway pseudopilin PulG